MFFENFCFCYLHLVENVNFNFLFLSIVTIQIFVTIECCQTRDCLDEHFTPLTSTKIQST